MLEILFTDSAAGGLKHSKDFGKGKYSPHTALAVLTEDGKQLSGEELELYKKEKEEKERTQWEKAVPMDIDIRDVVPVNFGLATGDISEDYPAEKRLEYLKNMLSIYPGLERAVSTEKWFGKMQANLDRVLGAVKDNQPVRLWYSDNPDELCGLYHIVYLIDKINPGAEIYTVKLPAQYVREDGTIISYNGWGDVSKEEWHLHFKTEKMTQPFKILCVTNWRRLKADRSPPPRTPLRQRAAAAPAPPTSLPARQPNKAAAAVFRPAAGQRPPARDNTARHSAGTHLLPKQSFRSPPVRLS